MGIDNLPSSNVIPNKGLNNIKSQIFSTINCPLSCISAEQGDILGYELDEGVLRITSVGNYNENLIKSAITKLIVENFVKTVNINGLKDLDGRRKINNILVSNYPLLEIVRFGYGDVIRNITFSGIKALNDKYSQCFVDEILFALKQLLIGHFDSFFAFDKIKGRLVRNIYKNLTFSSPSELNISDLFSKFGTQANLRSKILYGLTDMIQDFAQKNGFDPKEIVNDIDNELRIGIGVSSVSGSNDSDKLKAFYEAEIVSRLGISTDQIGENTFSNSNIQQISSQIQKLQSRLSEYKGQKFIYKGKKYPIFITYEGIDFLNPGVLKLSRKRKEYFPVELNAFVIEYINLLNKGFDFISPVIFGDKDYLTVRQIDEQFKSGDLDSGYFISTNKAALTKECLFETIKGRNGVRIFLDLKDLGVMNLQSFIELANKVNSGNYDENDLIMAGSQVTNRLMSLIKDLKVAIPGVQLAVGGDEIYLYGEHHNEKNVEDIFTRIYDALESNDFSGRISYSFDFSDPKSVFDNLDKSTSLTKRIETLIESRFDQFGYSESFIPRMYSLFISQKVKDFIGVLDLSLFKNLIDQKVINFIIDPNSGDAVYYLGEINGIGLHFEKNSLGFITIIFK